MYIRHAAPQRLLQATIGEKAPEISVSEWVQGIPTTLAQEKDHIVLVEVFQVNCPGCFLYGLPEMINVYNRFRDEGVRVLGLATAFEDFDKNTLENLRLLAEQGITIGETRRALEQYGRGAKLDYRIPFPLAMDHLVKTGGSVSDGDVIEFIKSQLPGFEHESSQRKQALMQRVRSYMLSKEYSAKTFETYSLRGTPSTIVVDRKGMLRDVSFGQFGNAEAVVADLLKED